MATPISPTFTRPATLQRRGTLPMPPSNPTDTALYSSLLSESPSNTLIRQATLFSKSYMSSPKFDASHNFNHILSVVALSLSILSNEQAKRERDGRPLLNRTVVILGALLHDVDDKKYASGGGGTFGEIKMTNNSYMDGPSKDHDIFDLMLSWGSGEEMASIVSRLCSGTSYTVETSQPAAVTADLIAKIPELAIVQDADRLDAIGAVGIGRCFLFGGAKTRSMGDCIGHFLEKLFKLERMMKTETGREMAGVRTLRLREFMRWWKEETGLVMGVQV